MTNFREIEARAARAPHDIVRLADESEPAAKTAPPNSPLRPPLNVTRISAMLKSGAYELAYQVKQIIRDETDRIFSRLVAYEKRVNELPRWIRFDDLDASHPPNTLCAYGAGVIKAFRGTDPLKVPRENLSTKELHQAGWMIVVAGVEDIEIEQDLQLRRISIRITKTGGTWVQKNFESPSVSYAGVYTPQAVYRKGDIVTNSGSAWVCLCNEPAEAPGDKPGEWQLFVRKGRDGKNGTRGRPGHVVVRLDDDSNEGAEYL